MTTFCSYGTTSLFSLRSRALPSQLLHHASAERLNLWVPTAQRNERGQTQPFPFDNYIYGIGYIVTTSDHINQIFADMSSETPSEDLWGAAEAQPEPAPIEQNMVAAIADTAEAIAANQVAGGATNEIPAEVASSTGVRKSSFADLANGDHTVITANFAQRLGPHKLLPRFSGTSTSQKTDSKRNSIVSMTNGHALNTELSEPDGAASVVDDDSTSMASTDAMATKNEGTQTAPDTDASKLFRATPASSVTDGDKSVVQSPNISPRSVRKPGPHHRLKALTLAHDVPLPQSPVPVAKSSTSDEGPATPVASAVEIEPVIIQDTPPAPPATIDDGDESDTSCVIITEFPNSLSNKEKNLDPKAEAWVPDDAVGPLPPSRPESPVNVTHNTEAVYINECCPVPGDWSVPTKIGSFAKGYLFDGPRIDGFYKAVLAHYSQYFATAFASDTSREDAELKHVMEDTSFDVFRKWISDPNELYVKSSNGVIQDGKNIDLKILVQLWRFAARIQAPLFANTVANAIFAKTITANDIVNAGDEIDALLQMISVNNTFRLLISHPIILHNLQADEKWPGTLLRSILDCLEMGRKTYLDIQRSSQTLCIYHLHSLGHTCMSE
ncbi:hypothetical protein QM012_005938 [Aureobasidium pullulans]|uniref:BTB domain-containing protein n=1 Tax=Aureobasidium pullulans TaxID=5580 RepID=A0ABR0TR45_AURPU